MMRDMSALEESYWSAYYQEVGPFGEDRADIRSAQVCQLLYDIHSGKRAQKRKLTDWLLFYKKQPKVDENITESVRNLFGEIAKHQGK